MQLQNYISEEDFKITQMGDLSLIIPRNETAVSNKAWNKQNLWNRSRIMKQDGRTVSQGFGKFFNLGMGPDDLNVSLEDVAKAIENREAIATFKIDGSLLIRSEYNNKVMLRTRGSFGYEHLDNGWEIDQIFKTKYPSLFHTGIFWDYSLLFEWVSPNNVIVIRYPEPDLVLVGGVEHSTMSYVSMEELEHISKYLNVPLVEHFILDSNGWKNLIATITNDKKIEGFVIRINDEQTLVKMKCETYLTKHRLKSNMKTETLIDLWLEYKKPSFQEMVAIIKNTYDEEIATWCLPVISTLYDGVKVLDAIVNHIKKLVEFAKSENMSRKDFAIKMQGAYGQTKKFGLAMNLFTDRIDNDTLYKGILLQNTKHVELGMFEHEV